MCVSVYVGSYTVYIYIYKYIYIYIYTHIFIYNIYTHIYLYIYIYLPKQTAKMYKYINKLFIANNISIISPDM